MIRKQPGFTLIETAMVVFIGGIIMASASSFLRIYMLEARISVTRSRMSAVDDAISQYMINNGAYPCPASLEEPPNSAAYGLEVSNDCYGGTFGAGTFRVASSGPYPNNTPVRIGAVPVRTLNLPDEFMMDGWNNRLYYAVTEILASPGNPSPTPLFNPTMGSIGIVDSNNNSVVTPPYTAHYILISAGQDGVGAYSMHGVMGIPCPAPNATLEAYNCQNANFTGQFRKTSMTGNAGAYTFDDLVTFHATSAQGLFPTGMTGTFYTSICPQGWGPPTVPQIAPLSAGYIYCQKL